MKRAITFGSGLFAACAAGAAHASDGFLQYGGAQVSPLSNPSIGLAIANGNPAAGDLALGDKATRRFGILSLPQIGYEFGPVDNFTDDFEAFEDDLDAVEELIDQAEQSGSQSDAQAANDAAVQLAADFNPILADIVDAAYVNIELQQQLPATPALFRAWGGVVSLSIAADLQAQVTSVGTRDPSGDILRLNDTDNDNLIDAVETDFSAFVVSGLFTEFAAGYSRALVTPSWMPDKSSLNVGGRLKIIQGRLSKQLAVVDDDGDDDEESETALDRVEENYDANEGSSIGFGADVGALARLENGLHFGVTLFNLLPPSFDFGDFGVNCGRFEADSGQRADCEATAEFAAAGLIDASRDYSFDTRLSTEVGYKIPKTRMFVGGTLDLTAAEAVYGDEYQWLTITTGYDARQWWVPNLVASYRQNLAGSKLSYLNVGLGLFGALRLNLAYGLESAEIDGDSAPRSAAVGIGFEMTL